MEKPDLIKVVVAVVILVVAIGIVLSQLGGGNADNPNAPEEVDMICPQTGHVFKMDWDDYKNAYMEKMKELGPMGAMGPMGPQPIGIPSSECDGELAFRAEQDPDTGEWYVKGYRQMRR